MAVTKEVTQRAQLILRSYDATDIVHRREDVQFLKDNFVNKELLENEKKGLGIIAFRVDIKPWGKRRFNIINYGDHTEKVIPLRIHVDQHAKDAARAAVKEDVDKFKNYYGTCGECECPLDNVRRHAKKIGRVYYDKHTFDELYDTWRKKQPYRDITTKTENAQTHFIDEDSDHSFQRFHREHQELRFLCKNCYARLSRTSKEKK
jgi:hypothetical protein